MDHSRLWKAFRHIDKVPELLQCIRHSDAWPALIGGYLGLRHLNFPREFRTPYGDWMTLETFHDLVTVWVVFYRNEYTVDPSLTTIIDAGANIGSFSLLASRVAPGANIIALEPFPATRARLDAHLARNGLGDRIACLPWALGSCNGRRFMADVDVPSQSRGLSDHGADEAGIAVETVDLETLLNHQGLDRVDLLKVDIEGSEHEVFLSARDEILHRIDSIALEYHPNYPKAPLFNRILAVGFRMIEDAPTHPGSEGGVAFFRR